MSRRFFAFIFLFGFCGCTKKAAEPGMKPEAAKVASKSTGIPLAQHPNLLWLMKPVDFESQSGGVKIKEEMGHKTRTFSNERTRIKLAESDLCVENYSYWFNRPDFSKPGDVKLEFTDDGLIEITISSCDVSIRKTIDSISSVYGKPVIDFAEDDSAFHKRYAYWRDEATNSTIEVIYAPSAETSIGSDIRVLFDPQGKVLAKQRDYRDKVNAAGKDYCKPAHRNDQFWKFFCE